MTRALVLGSNGFLGRHVTDALEASGLRVERAPPRARLDLQSAPDGALVALLRAAMPDVVVNAAGSTGGREADLQAGNVDLVARLVEACAVAAPGVRLVHLGSAAEYGPTAADVPVVEAMPARPLTAYGRSKLAGTRVVLDASRTGLVDGVVLRVFNPLGSGQPASTLPGRVAAQVNGTDPDAVIRVGSLAAWRDYVSVRDIGAAVTAAATTARLGAQVLNVAGGRAVLTRDLVHSMVALAGHRGPVLEDSGGSPRSAGVDRQRADVSLAGSALGWRPRISWEDALRDVLAGRLEGQGRR